MKRSKLALDSEIAPAMAALPVCNQENFQPARRWLTMVTATLVMMAMPRDAVCEWSIGTPIVTYYGAELTFTNNIAQQQLEGNWNLANAFSRAQLDIAQSHGLRAMWISSLDDQTVTEIRNHPALYSYYIVDEPSASDFPNLRDEVARLRALDPNHPAYINLFPIYADPTTQLGTAGHPQPYIEYLDQFINTVQPALLSYDHYHFRNGGDSGDYFKNLAIISYKAKQAGIPFMNVVQAVGFDSFRVPNGNELRYLYTTSLAYGAQGISDFVYYSSGGFQGGMALSDGTTTTLYDAATSINRDFVAMAKKVQPLNHVGAYHLGDLPYGFGTTDGSSPVRIPGNSPFSVLDTPDTTYVNFQPVKGLVMGLYGPDNQLANAVSAVVVNLNYTQSVTKTVTGPGNLSIFDPVTNSWSATGQNHVTINMPPGGGVLVSLTSAVPNPTPHAAAVLYRDSFNGTGALHGRTPEVVSNQYGASNAATWSASLGGWTLNGSQAAINTNSGQRAAFVPFTPAVGEVYRLSVDINPISSGASTGHWLALGYSNTGTNFSADGVGWVLDTISGNVHTFLGPNEFDHQPFAQSIVNPKRFTLVLDTTNEFNWSFTWLMSNTDGSGSQVLRPTQFFDHAAVINHVGLLSSSNINGTIDNFQLSVDAVPLEGDFNHDGKVDAADYVVWRKGLTTGTYTQPDYDIWQSQFGLSLGNGSSAAATSSSTESSRVPEPSSIALLVFAVLSFAVAKRQ